MDFTYYGAVSKSLFHKSKVIILRKIFSVILVVVLSIIVFTAASYANTFASIFVDCFAKLIISYLWGIILYRYFNILQIYTSTAIIIILTLFVLFPLGEREVNILLPTYSVFICGFFLGYYWVRIQTSAKVLFLCLIAVLIIIDKYIIYPRYYFSYMNQRTSILIGQPINNFLQNAHLQNQAGSIVRPFKKGTVYLVEFYFNNCPPCKMKAKDLQTLDNLDIHNFEIIWVDNGDLDRFSAFAKVDLDSKNHFYDNAGQLTKNLNIRSFPFEVIIDQSGIIRYVFKGYASDLKTSYINETVKKIKTLLHE